MSTRRSSRQPPVHTRGSWVRTNADLSLNNPDGWLTDPANGPVWWIGTDEPSAYTGRGAAGDASGLAVVTRATSLVVDPIATSPLKVQEYGSAGGHPMPTPRWLSDPMLKRPDGRFAPADLYPAVLKLTRSKFWGDFLRSALWWGHGAFICIEDESGQPTAGTMKLISPHMLTTERDEGGTLCWVLGATGRDDERVVFDRDGYVTLGSVTYRLVVLRNPLSPIDIEGRSQGVFEMSPTTFGIAGQILSYTSGTFRSGVPAGYLKTETPGMQQPQADELRAKWMQHHGGDRRSIAVLNSTTSFVPLNLSPVDAALGEVTRLSVASVAYAFGIDPNMLGAGLQNSASYSNVRDYFRQHAQLGIGNWIAALQDCLSAFLPGSQGVRIDLDDFLRPEPKERYDAYSVAITAGILTVPEVREMEGLPALPTEQEQAPAPPPPVPAPTPLAAVQEPDPTTARSSRVQPWRH